MTHTEDLLRLRDQEIKALRSKVEELQAKIEILTNNQKQWLQAE